MFSLKPCFKYSVAIIYNHLKILTFPKINYLFKVAKIYGKLESNKFSLILKEFLIQVFILLFPVLQVAHKISYFSTSH